MRAVVLSDGRVGGGELVLNAEFLRFAAHWDSTRARAGRIGRRRRARWSGRSRYLRDSFFYGRAFANDEDLNEQASRWLEGTACIVIGPDVQAGDGVEVQDFAGGRYAVATHRGSYTRLAETYSGLIEEWVPANRLELAEERPCVEVYRNDPQQTPENELVTDVHVPIRG